MPSSDGPGTALPAEPRLPEGKLVRTTASGTDALKRLLVELKRYSFSGYVKSLRSGPNGTATGYVVLEDGTPVLALHLAGRRRSEGKVALKAVWEDSYESACTLEVHAKVDVAAIRADHPDAGLERPVRGRKGNREGKAETPLKAAAKPEAPKAAPQVAQTPQPEVAPLDDRSRVLQERARQVFEMIVRQRSGEDRPEAPTPREIEAAPLARDPRTNLVRAYTFDAFVVGPSNRFAHAACAAVAKSPHSAYNPLFITAGPGLGKTHLLNGIGNAIAKRDGAAKVRYVTAEGFANEYREAAVRGRLTEFRERYRRLDVLLFDDAQFLSGRADVQEELHHTFNELFTSGRQIVLASDRRPKEFPDLQERLVSRFESGLVADLAPPEYETRLAILRRKARDAGVAVGDEVLSFIARHVENNVRELGGALNRVIAFSTLMDQPVSLDLAREVLKELAEVEGLRAGAKVTEAARELRPGHAYLVEEDRPEQIFQLLRVAGSGGRSLLVTRSNPRRVRERHKVRADRILWLTEREGGSEDTIPPSLERIVYVIEEFMHAGGGGAVALDGVEYLVGSNSFDSVLKFLRRLVDDTSESQFVLLVSISPKTMKDQEVKNLEREMDVQTF